MKEQTSGRGWEKSLDKEFNNLCCGGDMCGGEYEHDGDRKRLKDFFHSLLNTVREEVEKEKNGNESNAIDDSLYHRDYVIKSENAAITRCLRVIDQYL